MILFQPCCKDCENRYPGCHGSCERYLSAKAAHDSKREKIRQERSGRNAAYEVAKATRAKIKRRNHDRRERN